MSDSEELKRVLERLLHVNNVKLKDLFQTVLQRIAGEFLAVGLIKKDVEDSMLVLAVTEFTLAPKLFNACQKLLVLSPESSSPETCPSAESRKNPRPRPF